MGEWRTRRLDEIVQLQRGHDLTQEQMRGGPYPVAGSNGIIDYHSEYTTEGPGITIGRSGNSIGVPHFYPTNFWAHNTTLYSKRFVDSDPHLVFYLLKTLQFGAFNTGSAVPSLNRNHLHTIVLPVPDLPEQRAIASVLSSLDAKIDLLHRQNKTLEALAEALFRQWFVEEAEEEAAEGTLADVAMNIRDGVPVNAFNADDRYVAMEHIDRRCVAIQQFGSSADVASNKYRFGVNDILFGKLRPYFHKVCLTSFAGICSTDILVIRPKRPELLYYCLFAFFQDEVVEYANAGSGGTRMPRTSWSDLSKYPIALPGKEKLEAFNKVVQPMMDKLQTNIPQIRSLTALRDTLLPKLMSGEVRVDMAAEEMPL